MSSNLNYVDQQYHDLLNKIMTEGSHKADRTGTGTRSLFGYQMRFDLQDSFPLLTTKKVHIPSVVGELLWFLQGDTNISWLKENKIRIWDEWRQPYSLDRPITIIDKKHAVPFNYDGDFSIAGLNASRDSEDANLANIWIKMMRRCYDRSHHKYSLYGAKGVTVHENWHDVTTFIEEVKTIPHWYYKQNNWNDFELDKDYFGSQQYGLNTSVWLRTDENNYYTSAARPIEVTNAVGEKTIYITQNEVTRSIGITNGSLSRFIKNGVPSTLKQGNKMFVGWEFKTFEPTDKLVRLQLIEDGDLGPIYGAQWRSWTGADGQTHDQMSEAIKLLKTNPDSRRILVSAWNVGELSKMALMPCHALFQFYVADGKLSCQLYQRSCDAFLGLPFNLSSYALLTAMMAQQTGLELGEFVWTGGDVHIYDNHHEQVQKQLSRDSYALPTLKLNKAASLFDYTLEDVVFENYLHHPGIKAPVAV